jgi:hypothetical protein
MWKTILTLFLVLAIAPAHAKSVNKPQVKTPPKTEFKYESALQKLDQKVIKLVGEEKQKTLRDLASAAVLSDYCAAVNLDHDKFTKTFDSLAARDAKRKPAEQRDLENNLMTYFGVYVGLLVAEGTDRQAKFCALAETIQKEHRPLSRFWLATTPTPAAPTAKPAATAVKQ